MGARIIWRGCKAISKQAKEVCKIKRRELVDKVNAVEMGYGK
jgi:hypothetical protein